MLKINETKNQSGFSVKKTAKKGNQIYIFSKYGMLLLFVLIIICFSLALPGLFPKFVVFRTILATQSVLAIIAIAMLLPLTVGNFDLSAASNVTVSMIVSTTLMARFGVNVPVALLCGLIVSTLIGFINALLVTRVGINPIIATLGTSTIIQGLVYGYTGGMAIVKGVPESLQNLASPLILGIPLPVYYMIIIAVIVWYMLEQTPLGRHFYAVGGSKNAARLAGINTTKLTMLAFTLCGFLAGIAGIIMAAKLGSGNPNIGPSFMLPAFAAVFLGAAAFKPGTFNVAGTVLAIFTLATGVTGMQLAGAPYWIDQVFNGVALILAVSLVRYLRGEEISPV